MNFTYCPICTSILIFVDSPHYSPTFQCDMCKLDFSIQATPSSAPFEPSPTSSLDMPARGVPSGN